MKDLAISILKKNDLNVGGTVAIYRSMGRKTM